jgi:hypothetical protein
MENSRTITSIFMAVALVAMAALAISVNQKSVPEVGFEFSPLPGLAENLHSVEGITQFPAGNIRSVRIVRTNGDEIAVIRDEPATREFQFETTPPESITPYSAILFANASFLDALKMNNAIAVTGFSDEAVIGELTYSSFDGLVLKFVVFRANDATWLRMIAAHSAKLAARYDRETEASLLPTDEIVEIAHRLNGRIYKKPDNLSDE